MKKWLNGEGFSSFVSSCIAIAIGLLFGLVIILFTNPANAFDGFLNLIVGPIRMGMMGIGRVLFYAIPIIMTGLSVGFAFKTGLFNIGTPGQFITGAFAAVYVGVHWTFLPAEIHWIIALLAAFIVGGMWAVIPGMMKAYLNVNEVISSIMMNYIGMYLVNFLVKTTVFDELRSQSLGVASSAEIPKLGLDQIFRGSTLNAGILIALGMVVIIYIILNKTKFGYEMKACGYNADAARYAGINEKKNIILAMVIAGSLAGIGGGLVYLSGSGKFISIVEVLAPEGFNGIPVALLGLSNPIGIFFSGVFISYLTVGGNLMQQFGFIPEIVDIIISAIIYCSALSLMIKLWLAKRKSIRKTQSLETKEGDS